MLGVLEVIDWVVRAVWAAWCRWRGHSWVVCGGLEEWDWPLCWEVCERCGASKVIGESDRAVWRANAEGDWRD